jgi:hypothetical protein
MKHSLSKETKFFPSILVTDVIGITFPLCAALWIVVGPHQIEISVMIVCLDDIELVCH